MPILIWGGYTKVAENSNIILNTPCPKCHASKLFAVMIIQRPHLFFIPIPFVWLDEEPGLWCKVCDSKFSVEFSTTGFPIQQFYRGKITKKELKEKLTEIH